MKFALLVAAASFLVLLGFIAGFIDGYMLMSMDDRDFDIQD